MKAKLCIIVLAGILILTALWSTNHKVSKVAALDEKTYSKVKALLVTQGTRLSTVKLRCSGGRMASGTLVKNSDFEVIITAAHFFSSNNPDDTYEYALGGVAYPIHKVSSHPKIGATGERDIAFCFPGSSRKIQSYAEIPRDVLHTDLSVGPYPITKGFKLDGNIPVEIGAVLCKDPKNPDYLIQYDSKDGESGSGIMCGKRFFVLSGNIPVGYNEISSALGLPPTKLTILVEL